MHSFLICCNWVDFFPSYGPRYGELQADYELFLALIEHSHVQNRGSARTRTAMSTMATSSLGTLPRRLPWRIDLLLATRYLRVCIEATNVALSVRNILIPHGELVTAIALEAGVDRLTFVKKQKFNTWAPWTLKRRERYVETPPSPLAPCPRLPQCRRRNESERGPDSATPWSSLLLIQGSTGATCIRGSPRFQCDSPTGFTVSPVLFQPTLPQFVVVS